MKAKYPEGVVGFGGKHPDAALNTPTGDIQGDTAFRRHQAINGRSSVVAVFLFEVTPESVWQHVTGRFPCQQPNPAFFH